MNRLGVTLASIFALVLQLTACTTGSGTNHNNPGVPGVPSGGAAHMYISSIANPNGAIFVYTLPITTSSTPVATLTTIGGPTNLFIDKNGRLFVPFLSNNVIWVYNTPLSAASTPAMILNTISSGPYGVTEDANGDVFANIPLTNCCIDIFPAPVSSGQTAAAEITSNSVSPNGLSFPYGIAADSSNNVYTASNTSIIQLQPPLSAASKPVANVPAAKASLKAIAIDGSNDVYVAVDTAIAIYHQPFMSTSTPAFSITIPGIPYVQGMGFDAKGDLWVTEPGNNVWEIAAPITASSTPQKILTGVPGPWGIAFGP
ncbi:MAG: hypothetical protein JOY86_07205 [Candidatus Eremiobacteraeota bacterium]|nr:hypothetical protein [Candidatus Eremiobacteraeota bacterium]